MGKQPNFPEFKSYDNYYAKFNQISGNTVKIVFVLPHPRIMNDT